MKICKVIVCFHLRLILIIYVECAEIWAYKIGTSTEWYK